MSFPLVAKELREHRRVLFASTVSWMLLLLLIWSGEDRAGALSSPFQLVASFLGTFSWLGSHLLVQRLVVREWAERTHTFLFSMPVGRGRVLAAKFLIGLVTLLGTLGLAIAASILLVDSAVTDAALVLRASTRAAAFLFAIYAFLFLVGLLGRYRWPFLLLFVSGVAMLAYLNDVEPDRLPPFPLLGEDFAFERALLPTEHLFEALGIGAIFTLAGFSIALARDGLLAELISGRMSTREKVAIAVLFLGVLSWVERRMDVWALEPFTLDTPAVARQAGFEVSIAVPDEAATSRSQALATRLSETVGRAATQFGWSKLPNLFVVSLREHDGAVYERVRLEHSTGLILAANLSSPAFDEQRFVAFALREMLRLYAPNLNEERFRWWLNGFAAWWMRGDEAERAQLRLRAAEAVRRVPLELSDLETWLTRAEKQGPCVTDALATELVFALADAIGEERVSAVMADVLAAEGDLSVDEAIHRHGGSLPELVASLNLTLAATDPDAHATVTTGLTLRRLSSASFAMDHALTREPPLENGRYRALYAKLEPFEAELQRSQLQVHNVRAGAARTLPGTMIEGERWFFAFELEEPALGCAVRHGAERRTIR